MAVAAPLLAQNHELAVTAGGEFPVNADSDLHSGFAVEASYAGRLLHIPAASLYLEVPVAIGLKNTGTLPSASALERRQYSSLFVAPGLKLKLLPELPVSPFFTLGAGVAHFKLDASNTSPQQTSTTSVLQIGGGLDMKILPFMSVRGQVRDYFSGNPVKDFSSGVPSASTFPNRQHNILTTVGLVLRF